MAMAPPPARKRHASRRLAVSLVVAGLLGSTAPLAAAPAVSPDAEATASALLMLEYAESAQPVASVFAGRTETTVVFAKEPTLSTQQVLRASLHLGQDTNAALPFAWDLPAGRFYLDLNRNRDLTDDPTGVIASKPDEASVTFTNLHLTLATSVGPQPATVDLRFSGFTLGTQLVAYVHLDLRSFWQGKWTWQDRDWHVAIVQRLDEDAAFDHPAYLVLRPWDARTNHIDLVNGTPDAVDFPRRLFWLGHAFRIEGAFVRDGNELRYKLELKEQRVDMGELQITGGLLHRLFLEDTNGYAAVLDSPRGPVQLPLGTYQLREVWVRHGTSLALQVPDRRIAVQPNTPATLIAGGPLTNSVTLERHGRDLVIDYQLLGQDGGVFHRMPVDRTKPPRFAIHKGGRQLASGQFEFG